jgi:hypothetical protein
MGYRSQVRSLIYGDPALICALVAADALTGKGGIALNNFGDSLKRYSFTTSVYDNEATNAQKPDANGGRNLIYRDVEFQCLDLCGDFWKWYPDYPDVMAWENLLIRAAEMGLNTEFVRIGEEDDDVEIRRDLPDEGDYLIGVSRSIHDDIPDTTPVDYDQTVAA